MMEIFLPDYFELSLKAHERARGKIEIKTKLPVGTREDLSLAYTPGVARPCMVIAEDPERAYDLTLKGNSVGIVTDGSAVLGLGNIGGLAAAPVMEGKALLFKEFAGIDAWPICLDTQETAEIIETVRRIAPIFGGINLEDIAAPRCFEIEDSLQDLGIPVFHDDQHGTAIVLLAALINAELVTGKKMGEMRVVINGAGAAGTAIAKMLRCVGHDPEVCTPVAEVIMCDSKGAVHAGRGGLSAEKQGLLAYTNPAGRAGSLKEVIEGADVFIGVSMGNLLDGDDVRRMNDGAVILAMANPIPEIMPEEALAAGAAIVCTGRSDFPNQVNNSLAFPGVFRGALDARAARITSRMKIAAAHALADAVAAPSAEEVIPHPLDRSVAGKVAEAVRLAA